MVNQRDLEQAYNYGAQVAFEKVARSSMGDAAAMLGAVSRFGSDVPGGMRVDTPEGRAHYAMMLDRGLKWKALGGAVGGGLVGGAAGAGVGAGLADRNVNKTRLRGGIEGGLVGGLAGGVLGAGLGYGLGILDRNIKRDLHNLPPSIDEAIPSRMKGRLA